MGPCGLVGLGQPNGLGVPLCHGRGQARAMVALRRRPGHADTEAASRWCHGWEGDAESLFCGGGGGGESLETAGDKAALRGGGDDDAPDGRGIELLERTKTRASAGSSQRW
jgi:hypothetical protein